MPKENMIIFNLKLRESVKERFKSITRERGTTMQSVLATFTESFVDNPDQFKIRMEVINAGRVGEGSPGEDHI